MDALSSPRPVPRTLFVTGTDTEVGKSATTACLAEAVRAAGWPVCAAKPVASGVPDGEAGEDAELIALAAGHPPLIHATYLTPVSPHRAALLEDAPLDVAALRQFIERLGGAPCLVEGVGGWRAPVALTDDGVLEQAQLAAWCDADVLVVVANRLGCLSHARLTVQAIRADGLHVFGVVVVEFPGASDVSIASNAADLQLLLPDLPVAHLARIELADADARQRAGDRLWRELRVEVGSPGSP